MRTLVLLSVLPLFPGLLAQTPTIEQSMNWTSASAPRISPDGKHVAFQVTAADWEQNAFVSQTWLAVVATGERYQLTHHKKGGSAAEWSSDSKTLAFTADRDGKTQLYTISATGGEARQLTTSEGGVLAFHWSSDGQQIAFTSTGGEAKAKKDRKEKFGDFEIVNGDYAMQHIWVINVFDEKPKPIQLTEGNSFSVGGFSWSPDSRQLAFAAAKDPDISHGDTSDVYIVRLGDRGVRKIVATPASDTNPIWSPDGRQIAFSTSAGRDPSYLNRFIATISPDGGTPKLLTEKFDESPILDAWGPDGIYFGASQRTASHLFRVDPRTMAVTKISQPATLMMNGPSFTKDFTMMAFSCSMPNQYSEICVSPVADFAPKAITRMNDQLKDFRLASREVVEWKSKDGTPIEGILIKPADFDAGKKYPLLVVIHGGPTGVDRPSIAADRYYPIERFAAKGAVILRPNYRGSAGYGEKFRSLNVRNLGVGDYEDVIGGVDFLIAKGFVDKDRVASMGWSQGGYISAFITTYSDRFKAVSVGAGISDWMTYYVNTDIHPFTRHYLKATPWEDPEIYKTTSPITYINNARTPTLIQHGELDKRVPIPNAYELYQGLQDRNVPSKLIVYKGFGHGIDKPKQARAVMEHNYDWFSQWIWGEKPSRVAE